MAHLGTQKLSAIDYIKKGDLCTGCGACAAISNGAIDMALSEAGYLRPIQRDVIDPTVDQLILEVCPGTGFSQTSVTGKDHVLWSRYSTISTGASTDSRLRHHGSSGAALSAILTYLLDSNKVDRIVQVAASKTLPIANTTVINETAQDVFHSAGSRYAPSSPLARIDKELERPGKFALVGKPCDIAAARALGRHDPRIETKVPYMLSFFCAGVPSIEGARKILARLNLKEEEVSAFRYRGEGWPGLATAVTNSGEERKMSYAESWGEILSKHVQFRCKVCVDGTGAFADIVCADAWHSDDKGYPIFEDDEGRSLIVTRTPEGDRLLADSITNRYLTTQPLHVDEIEKMQPSQAARKRALLSRLLALKVLFRPTPKYEHFRLFDAMKEASLTFNIRSFVGTLRRMVKM